MFLSTPFSILTFVPATKHSSKPPLGPDVPPSTGGLSPSSGGTTIPVPSNPGCDIWTWFTPSNLLIFLFIGAFVSLGFWYLVVVATSGVLVWISQPSVTPPTMDEAFVITLLLIWKPGTFKVGFNL